MLRSLLQYRHYKTLDVFKPSVDDLILRLSSGSGVIDLQPLFFCSNLDVSTAFLFRESVKSLRAATEQNFGDALNAAQAIVGKRFRLPDLYWMIGGSEFNKACKDIHQFADQIIDRNLSSQRSEKQRVP